MSEIPEDLSYTKSHEWVFYEEDGTALVGISDHAQSELGELVYVELPEPGAELKSGDECAVVESVKAASDVYSPISGEVVEVNDGLQTTPGLVNNDPYGDGWLFRVNVEDESELTELMPPDDYKAYIDETS